MSTRGDYASRALLSLCAPRRRVGAHLGQRHRRAHGPPPALPGADPPGPEGRWPRAIEARRRRRLRPGTAARPRSRSSEIVSAVDGPIVARRLRPAATGRRLRPRGPVRAARDLERGRRPDAHRSSIRTPWPTSRPRPVASGPGRPRTSDRALTRSAPPNTSFEVSGQGRLELDSLARHRVLEGEPLGVQERPRSAGTAASSTAVAGVADDRMTDGGEVHADLVSAAGLELALDQR